MKCCKKCGMMCGVLLLVVGLLYLLQDLGTISWWTLNWYTVAFLLLGLGSVGSRCCADCQSCCTMPAGKKK